MGAWGAGPFDNDDACDWSYQLLDGGGAEGIASALDISPGTEAPEAAEAVAAIDALLTDSELADLWGESGESLWQDDLREWRSALDA